MITRKPKVGDLIEYNPETTYNRGVWKPVGAVVAVVDNFCYLHDKTLPETAHAKLFGKSPVPPGCETANYAFLWNFRDAGMNQLHRICE